MALGGLIKWWVRLIWFWIVDSVKAVMPLALWPKKSITGQLVLITGGAGGIGYELAIEFGKQGCSLIIWDVDMDKLKETEKSLQGRGFKCSAYLVDVGRKESVHETADLIKKKHGDVDILVNCAGKSTNYNFLELVDERVEECLQVNLLAHFYTLRAFLPSMTHKNRGHVVAIGSYFGLFGSGPFPEYSTSKFGVMGMMESLRLHLKHEQVDINTTIVCPGYCSTAILAGFEYKSFLVPQLKPDYVAKRVVESVRANQTVVLLPRGSYFLNFLHKIVPSRMADELNLMSHVGYELLAYFNRMGYLPERKLIPSNVTVETGKSV